jgi:hypothetical protein
MADLCAVKADDPSIAEHLVRRFEAKQVRVLAPRHRREELERHNEGCSVWLV